MDLTARFLNPVLPDHAVEIDDELPAVEIRQPAQRPLGRSLPRLEEQAISRLVTKYLEGVTVNELTKDFSINVTTVHDHLKRSGVQLRPFRKLKAQQVAQAAALYERGSSIYAIANQFGVSWNTLQTALVEAGVQLRPSRRR